VPCAPVARARTPRWPAPEPIKAAATPGRAAFAPTLTELAPRAAKPLHLAAAVSRPVRCPFAAVKAARDVATR
jgi:hypothetical protein